MSRRPKRTKPKSHKELFLFPFHPVFAVKDGSLFCDHEFEGLQSSLFPAVEGQGDPADINPLAEVEKIQARLLDAGVFDFLDLGYHIPGFVINDNQSGPVGRHIVNGPGYVAGSGGGINVAGITLGKGDRKGRGNGKGDEGKQKENKNNNDSGKFNPAAGHGFILFK